MLINEVDFTRIDQHKNTNIVPVFMQYGNECYEIITSKKHTENSWPIFQKLFYYKFFLENKEYLDGLFEQQLFSTQTSKGLVVFSKSDKTFYNELSTDRNTAAKFGSNAYVFVMENKYNNLVVLKKIVTETNIKDFKLFIAKDSEIESDEFKKELHSIKKQYARKKKKPIQIKKGNLVVGHINGVILSEQEKLIKYVRDEFKKKNLLGDIVLTDEQDRILNEYMKIQLHRLNYYRASFKPEYSQVFAFGLVRYAMKNYNTRGTGGFWPYFETDYGISILINNQKYIHSLFETIMKRYGMIYANDVALKIDNITMHSFVADHSANQLFDFLFDYWRLDLRRNSDNFNASEKGESVFSTLIEAMKHGTQDVMTHTSLLLNFDKIRPAFKNRVKRIIRLMNESFWNDTKIRETGNRINHLLNLWIDDSKGAFQKEKKYITKHSSKEKGEILFHSPVLNVNYLEETLSITLPHQRLIDCIEEDRPFWSVKCSNLEFEPMIIETNEHYKHDKISCYVESMTIEIPLHLMLSEFEFTLINDGKEIKKHKIRSSKVRFFDENGKYIDHKDAIVPAGRITSYSDDKAYPMILGEKVQVMSSDRLVMKYFNLVKGQIITLEDMSGIQVGQKLAEGLNEIYPIVGANVLNNGVTYKIYPSLPKLLFKADSDDIKGISLIINGKQNRINDKPIKDFKISKELKTSGYLIDLKDYISCEGLYQISLSYHKKHKQIDIDSIAYINGFNYRFIDAPYIFTENGTIRFERNVKIDKNIDESDGSWSSDLNGDSFNFNFGERNSNSENYCKLVKDKNLILNCIISDKKYPIIFEIPALYWRFTLDEKWNTRQPSNIPLKNFKNKIKKLYVDGPFNFSKSFIFTTDDIDIAEEESEIKLINGKNKHFEIEKIYNWFKSDRTETYRRVYISLDESKINLLNVICKSGLKNVSLIGDFDNSLLEGTLDLEGNESYTVSIYHNGYTVCEDKQVIDKKFSVETDLETGNYEIYVYEISEDDEDDGFDIGTDTILLNKKPIVKKLINLADLEKQKIVLLGYQDLKQKYISHCFPYPYIITGLNKITYSQALMDEPDSEIYGIWNEDIDCRDEEQMNSFILYKGKLGIVNRYDGSFTQLMKVFVIFTNKLNPESIIILAKDSDGVDYGSLTIDKSKEWIIPAFQYKKYTKIERRKCDSFFDDQYFYLNEIEEA